MSTIPLFCIVLLASVQVQSQFGNFFRGPLKPTFKYTGGLSGNLGANYKFNNGNSLGGHIHGNLKSPGLINGVGLNGSVGRKNWRLHGNINQGWGSNRGGSAGLKGTYNLGKGWRFGGHINHRWGPNSGTGGGISISKTFGKRRSTVCMSRCAYACRISTVKCVQNCLVNMC
ncbi:uncharacterized protein [Mytilus edulis]|uniref:uncharacterized protein isoform X1 n=1 Tax=Mytilus edulis TaxID=6550 RepID=UPI0039EE5F94